MVMKLGRLRQLKRSVIVSKYPSLSEWEFPSARPLVAFDGIGGLSRCYGPSSQRVKGPNKVRAHVVPSR